MSGGSAPSTRDRILDAASELFYAHGIRAVSADKVIERAGITKVTFYRHFRTKDSLVVAYLERQAAWERAALDDMRRSVDDAEKAFRRFAHAVGAEACRPGFRGCSFINAAAEYAAADSPVRTVVAEHRAWYHETFTSMLEQMDVPDADEVADELMMLRDGAMLSGYLGDPARVADALERAMFSVIDGRRAVVADR
jgi:AcrR family transcriptional regulator